MSKGKNTDFGVPQGSVLGPLLFCLYIQEIYQIFTKYQLNFHIFADDIQIYSTITTGLSEVDNIIKCLEEIKCWTNANCLKLNDKKTKFVEIRTRLSKVSLKDSNITNFNGKCEPFARNLGILVDENISFKNQITDVCKKGFFKIRQLWKISSKLKSIELRTQLIHSYILPKIDYCNSVYYNLPQQQIKKLQRLLNAAIRFVFKIRRRTSVTPFLKKAHILPVNLRIRFKVCVLAFKCVNGCSPKYLTCMLRKKTSLGSLRISNDTTLLHEPRLDQRNYKNRQFEIYGPREWNVLPRDLREICSLDIFKSRLKTFLFDKF